MAEDVRTGYYISRNGLQNPDLSLIFSSELSRFDIKLDKVQEMNQVHGDTVYVVETYDFDIPEADALITNKPGLPLCVKTADCVPIVLSESETGVISVVHAGHKGTRLRIVSKTVGIMVEKFGVDVSKIKAFIGPSIGACCFETSEEIAEEIGLEFTRNLSTNRKPLVDLKAANENQLICSGVLINNIIVSPVCTCHTNGWPSWRRDKTSQRICTIAWLRW